MKFHVGPSALRKQHPAGMRAIEHSVCRGAEVRAKPSDSGAGGGGGVNRAEGCFPKGLSLSKQWPPQALPQGTC